MKAPWKYLSQLMSGKPASEVSQQSIGHDGDSKVVEIEAKAPSVPASTSPAAAPSASDDASASVGEAVVSSQSESAAEALLPVGVEETERRVAEKAPNEVADATAPAATGEVDVKQQRKPRATSRKGVKNIGSDAGSQPGDVEGKPQAVQSLQVDPFFGEAADLDEEIRNLRGQLAEKLQSQNAQLKKMLERFDRG